VLEGAQQVGGGCPVGGVRKGVGCV
jgi:hypothetical protein